MCMEDMWMARHTVYKHRGTVTTPMSLEPDPRRIAIILVGHINVAVRDYTGNLVADIREDGIPFVTSWSTTTQVPPGVDTTTQTAVSYYSYWKPTVLHIRDYGCVIQQGLTLTSTSGGYQVVTISGDERFEQAYNKFERARQ